MCRTFNGGNVSVVRHHLSSHPVLYSPSTNGLFQDVVTGHCTPAEWPSCNRPLYTRPLSFDAADLLICTPSHMHLNGARVGITGGNGNGSGKLNITYDAIGWSHVNIGGYRA